MKTEELKAQGLTQEQINFVMSENGKDIGKIQRELDDMTAERDKEKGRADSAEETLKGFNGVNVEDLKNSIADWKKKAEDAEKDYKQKIADRDFDDLLKEAIKSANGLNEKAIMGCLDIPALKASKNQKSDIESAIKALAHNLTKHNKNMHYPLVVNNTVIAAMNMAAEVADKVTAAVIDNVCKA